MTRCEICQSNFDEIERIKGNECTECNISFDNVCDSCICYCDKHEKEICCDCYAKRHNNCS
ncbi:MAG: hypothetical protein GY861_17325 [bacterium]|nr:hypothetical protein [bacterium]